MKLDDDDDDTDDTEELPEPTEAETEAVRRRCLDAARAVLDGLVIGQRLERGAVARLVLEAMRAAAAAWDSASTRVFDVDVQQIVATALWEQVAHVPPEDYALTSPYAAGGEVFEGYARAARLLEAYSDLHQNLDDDDDLGTAAEFASEVLELLGDPDEPEPEP